MKKEQRVRLLLSLCVIFFVSILFLTSCDMNLNNENGDEYGDTVIRGKVIDKINSEPLDSVKVSLLYLNTNYIYFYEDLKPKTDSTGSFYYEYYCWEGYHYHLDVEKEGYETGCHETYPFSVDEGDDNYFLIEMIKKDTTKTE